MNAMVHLILNVEKELEMEQQGFRRTRRCIGDASQVVDHRWYARAYPHAGDPINSSVEDVQILPALPHPEARRSLLSRLFRPSPARCEPACQEC